VYLSDFGVPTRASFLYDTGLSGRLRARFGGRAIRARFGGRAICCAEGDRAMHTSSTILLAIFTSAMTAVGTVYVIERYGVLPPRVQAVPDTLVPDFHGVTESDARANAGVSHIALLVAAREPSADTKPGTVIRQSIPAGQRVPREHPVSVVLAEEVPRVPKVVGLTTTAATAKLEERGYRSEVVSVPSPDVALGLVVEQSPKAEAAEAKGGAVTLKVSSGPSEIEVPKVVGLSVTAAQKAIEGAGAKAVVRWVSLAETATYVVLSQKPAAGAKMKPGDEVELVACR
jgi:beta-lactam-binding protein with PASTA domain